MTQVKISPETLNGFNHIPTTVVRQDIADTEKEISDYTDELQVLKRNPVENRVRIYMIEGQIGKRRDFVYKLQQILEYRGEPINSQTN